MAACTATAATTRRIDRHSAAGVRANRRAATITYAHASGTTSTTWATAAPTMPYLGTSASRASTVATSQLTSIARQCRTAPLPSTNSRITARTACTAPAASSSWKGTTIGRHSLPSSDGSANGASTTAGTTSGQTSSADSRAARAARAATAAASSVRAAEAKRTLPICHASCVTGANASVKASA